VKDAWYGDKRDLIKWGALVHLARHNRARKIIQVAFFRPTVLDNRPHLESEGQEWPVAEEVWFHFRDLRSIRHLARRCGLKIDVLGTRFDHANRDKYFRDVVRALEAAKGRKVVLLDPDTGMEPTRRTESHVGRDEIEEVWRALSSHDWLVLYQHQRRESGWRDEVRKEFSRACDGARVDMFASPRASDVAFFVASK